VPVYLDIENPAVVLTEVDIVFIEPSVLAEPWPFAFQFHETKESLLLFVLFALPVVKPSVPKAVNSLAFVCSASPLFEARNFVTPLTASNKALL